MCNRVLSKAIGRAAAGLTRLPATASTALFLLFLASFATPVGISDAAAQAPTLSDYRLGAGDRLKVTVFGHPQESGEFEVDGSGNLAYPLLGRVEAKGKTVPELQDFLRKELNEKFIVDPRVSVEVLNYRPFYIYGEVNRAGSYPYVAGLTVRRAVAIAGGFTRRAQREPVTVIREREENVDKIDTRLDTAVLPGDIIEVPRRLF
jgi:protein involved in polysaccharide export with SLBB domain